MKLTYDDAGIRNEIAGPMLVDEVWEFGQRIRDTTDREADAAGYRRGLEDACKAICWMCAQGLTPRVDGTVKPRLIHKMSPTPADGSPECLAAAIRKLMEQHDAQRNRQG